jgi:hypothetical protein
MQSSAYNNPMFAQGLAQLVQGFIGDPGATAQNEELASRALLNNQTAQFRDQIGETGTQGDLATMMIRALQAGPEYSGNAPRIGDAAINMGQRGYGNPEMAPSMDIASMFQAAMQPAPRAPAPRAAPSAAPAPVAPATPAAPTASPDATSVLNEAREAIRMGRDPEAVAARLREMGIDPSQL